MFRGVVNVGRGFGFRRIFVNFVVCWDVFVMKWRGEEGIRGFV